MIKVAERRTIKEEEKKKIKGEEDENGASGKD